MPTFVCDCLTDQVGLRVCYSDQISRTHPSRFHNLPLYPHRARHTTATHGRAHRRTRCEARHTRGKETRREPIPLRRTRPSSLSSLLSPSPLLRLSPSALSLCRQAALQSLHLALSINSERRPAIRIVAAASSHHHLLCCALHLCSDALCSPICVPYSGQEGIGRSQKAIPDVS